MMGEWRGRGQCYGVRVQSKRGKTRGERNVCGTDVIADCPGVPYSEHSSFFELTCFALSMPGPDLKMIATVNVHNEKR
jgi:hypothetical protein